MKQKLYYVLFTLLGAMSGFFLHAVIEVFLIKLFLQDLNKYGLGMTWENWEMIHMYGVPLLTLMFAFWGYRQGMKWWRILYIEQRYMKRWGAKLKKDF